MQIISNYDGASIDVIKNNDEIILSPKIENKKYSNYYNFVVSNDLDKKSTITLINLNNRQYQVDDITPLYRDNDGKYKKIDKSKIQIVNGNLNIFIKPKEKIEISSYPRYTINDLNDFLFNLPLNENIKIYNDVLKYLFIGDLNKKTIVILGRQHPGETLSSYFIEGVISSIINNSKVLKDYSFLIFPIVNQKGVKEGNHRYTKGFDYNRMWHTTNQIKEIDFIKSVLDKFNIVNLIDIHCDEITKKDYIRTKDLNAGVLVDNIQVVEEPTQVKRFLRALIKQRKIINIFNKTAREYVKDRYNCNTMLIELSLFIIDRQVRFNQGYNFIQKILEVHNDENRINTRKK